MKYNMALTPLSTIFIGSGEELYPYEYTIKNGYLYYLSIDEFIENLNSNEIEHFLEIAENNIIELRNFLYTKYREEFGYIYKVKVDKDFENEFIKKLNVTNIQELNALAIEKFTNSGFNHYIPGSSIKGYIRGAYLAYKGKDKISYKLERNLNKRTYPFNTKETFKETKFEKDIFNQNNLNPKSDPFKFVKISDTESISNGIIVRNIKRYNLKKGNQMMPKYIESLKGLLSDNFDKDYQFYITIDNEKNRLNTKISFKDILDSCNYKSQLIINKELNNTKNNINLNNFYKQLSILYDKIDKNNEALICIGQGAGFNSKTHNLVNKQFNPKQHTSVTKILTLNSTPLGWALISNNNSNSKLKLGDLQTKIKDEIKNLQPKTLKSEIKKYENNAFYLVGNYIITKDEFLKDKPESIKRNINDTKLKEFIGKKIIFKYYPTDKDTKGNPLGKTEFIRVEK
ncbi:MAG: CRISPR-associated protein Csm5 [Fusobacteriaceae bacterium]|jgi:CRISPR-associated protein Csm5|nr:csm5 [Fusobacteriales bacterium]MDN5305165.1 CRISPR-associated protein Csm5 [Fusobacteriaceae bacterium]